MEGKVVIKEVRVRDQEVKMHSLAKDCGQLLEAGKGRDQVF